MWIVRILFISILTIHTSFSTPSKSMFAFPPYFEEGLEEEASEDEYEENPSDVAATHVTYDKREYLSDMLRDYYSRDSEPSPNILTTASSGGSKTNTSKPNMGGYGKIDISIQYGCCANGQQNPESEGEQLKQSSGETETPTTKMQQVGQIVIQKDVDKKPTSRFLDPSQVFGNPERGDNMQIMHGYEPFMYRSSDYGNYAEDINDESMTTMNPSKSYSKNRYNTYQYEEGTSTTPKSTTPTYKQQLYESYEPVLVAQQQYYTLPNPGLISTMPPMMAYTRGLPIPTERKSFYTSERLLSPLNLYSGYTTPPSGYYQRGGPPENQPPSTHSPNSGGTSTTTPSYSYFGNHVTPRSILQHISKIVIQDVPSRLLYSGQQANKPQRREQTFNVPAQQQTTKEQIPANNNRNYYQQHQLNYQPPQNNYQSAQNTYQLPQNKFQQFENSYQPSQNQFNSSQNAPLNNNNYKPGMMYFDTKPNKFEPIVENNPTTEKLPTESNVENNLIKKNRQTFLKMQRQVYDLFTKGALNDFQTLLAKNIKKKNIELPLEEKNMLQTKIQPIEELNASILDYLTVYERYSGKLNNTELSNHILQYMDRAKEYLSLKLNKFWLELDSMDTPAEFQEKKNYYKNREKPTGIMNIFYDWYEKMLNNPGLIDVNKIQLKLVEVMKKERRYWLLLLKN